MTTTNDKQTGANTGAPKTQSAASSLNHLKHGSTSTSLFLKDENPDDFFALLEDAFAEHQPATAQAAGIVARSVHDHWILLRRERTADSFEAALHTRKPDPIYWVPCELHEINLLDRYKTAAARSYSRTLKDLQAIKKMARDEQRWQHQLETEKQKLAIHVERFNLFKKKQTPPPVPDFAVEDEESWENEKEEAAEPPVSTGQSDVDDGHQHVPPAPIPISIAQTLFIGLENGATVIFEITPSNAKLRRTLTEDHQVIRTYNFVGAVPPEYRHLITPDAVTWGKSTSVQKTLSFDEWDQLTAGEE